MQITTAGPWVLLAVGGVLLLMAGFSVVLNRAPNWPWIWIFGLACAGIGVYGPLFLEPYGKWLEPIGKMMEQPSDTTYAAAFHQVGDGKIPPKFQEMALTYALNNPVEGMDKKLGEAISTSSNPDGKEALKQLQLELKNRKDAASALAQSVASNRNALDQVAVVKLDPATRFYLEPELNSLPDAARNRLGIDQRFLDSLREQEHTLVPNLRRRTGR